MQNEHQIKLSATDQETTFIDHLIELRRRLLYIVAMVSVIFISLFFFRNDLYNLVASPLFSLFGPDEKLIAIEVASPFMAPFKLTFILSFCLAAPFILFQLWQFISPGLYRNEKKLAIPLLTSSIILFYSGMLFCYFVVLPLLFKFFTQVAPSNVTIMTDVNHYLDFVLTFFLVFAITFEVPIVVFLCIKTGITTVSSLSNKRPYIILACFVIGMLLTPADIFSQSFLAIPMWMLFELGLLLSRILKINSSTNVS